MGDLFDRLWEQMPECLRQILGERKIFSKSAADARNQYTHYNPSAYSAYHNESELRPTVTDEVMLAEKLRILLSGILLLELGFSHNDIADIVIDPCRGRFFRMPKMVSFP